jgi:NAD(P)-dependent dehydrogenase (short-subunit alcohol dehydrogenase family)
VQRLLEDKVTIVTGAGHGIGRGHALELARRGAKVVVNDVGSSVSGDGNGRDADLTVDLITSRGGTAVANYGDVGDETATKELIDQAVDTYGRLDVLVNNAGIVRDRAIWNMSPDDFDIVMRVHVRGTWLTSHFAAQHWRARAKGGEDLTGRIINTTSGAGLQGNFGQTNYATAKAAIVGMTQTASLELASIKVTVNAVGPGGLTRLSASVGGMGEAFEPDELGEDEYHPMDPAGSSPLVAWLASDQAQYITGQVFRAIHDNIFHMKGWYEAATISSGQKRWDAEKLGAIVAADIFGSRAAGIRS